MEDGSDALLPLATASQRARVRGSSAARAARPISAWLRAAVIGLLVLVLALAAMALVPSATITISPAFREQQAEVPIALDPKADTANADGHIPARLKSCG